MAAPTYTLAEGQPQGRSDTSEILKTGSGGGYLLLSSTQLLENLAHFPRERIPERTVHAKAAGARGYFEVTDDISDLTDADFLTGVGKKTEVLTRISTVGGESGSADTVRDFRGFAIKFKTNEGNQDWVFNNHPVFFVRDPVKFPSMNRSHKRDPATNRKSPDMFWDYHTANQESIHALMFVLGDRGVPSSVRHVNGFSGNTYKFTKANGEYCYTRIHVLTNQGIHYFTEKESGEVAGTHPDFHLKDLHEAIEGGDYPSWNVYVQTIKPEDIEKAPIDVFDITMVWPHKLYPLRKVGKMVLDKNPKNWFAEIEQAAFSPSNMVRGFEPSPDLLLQARMFSYPDAARYRLGANYQFLPTNAAKSEVYCPTERDGFMNFTGNYGKDPNYVGTQIKPPKFSAAHQQRTQPHDPSRQPARTADRADHGLPVTFASEVTDRDFEQSTALWKIMGKQEGCQERFIENVSGDVSGVTKDWLRNKVYEMFSKVDADLGKKLREATEAQVAKTAKNPPKITWH